VFAAEWNSADTLVLRANRALAGLLRLLGPQCRRVYLATGERLARGADGEPLLDPRTCELTPLPEGTRIVCPSAWNAVLDAENLAEQIGAFVRSGSWVSMSDIRRNPGVLVVDAEGRAIPEGGAAPSAVWEEGPIDSLADLVRAVQSRAPLRTSPLHGEDHWQKVAVVAARLLSCTDGADPIAVFCFCVLHDSQRLADGGDPEHGPRAARLARELLGDGALLAEERLEKLVYAIERHDAGERSADPTVAVCYDADRLNLFRVGTRPRAEYLSTAAAKWPENVEFSRVVAVASRSRWGPIVEWYEKEARTGGRGRP
jgi:uncharacterized protein